MDMRFEPTLGGVAVFFNGERLNLTISEVYTLQLELDKQLALASGCDLLNVSASNVGAEDILWGIGRETVEQVDKLKTEGPPVMIHTGATRLVMEPHVRLWVARAIE